MRRAKKLRNSLEEKAEYWKETLPSINLSELHRLRCRLNRHARLLSFKYEHGKLALIVGYRTFRDRISARVLLSSWVGKRRYQSVRLSGFKTRRGVMRVGSPVPRKYVEQKPTRINHL